MRNSMKIPLMKMQLLNDPVIPALGISSGTGYTDIFTPMFPSILLTIAKLWNQHKYSSAYEHIYIYI